MGGEQLQTEGANDKFLMHLNAEVPDQGEEKVQEAEFLVVVDRSGSMQGTPWKQVQGALCKMLELTRGQGNIRWKIKILILNLELILFNSNSNSGNTTNH